MAKCKCHAIAIISLQGFTKYNFSSRLKKENKILLDTHSYGYHTYFCIIWWMVVAFQNVRIDLHFVIRTCCYSNCTHLCSKLDSRQESMERDTNTVCVAIL